MADLDSRLAPPPPKPVAPPPHRQEARDAGLRPGKLLIIRYQVPLLPWPFRLLQRRRGAGSIR